GRVVFNIALFHLLVAGLASLALLLRPSLLEAIFGSRELVPYAPGLALLAFLAVAASFLEIIAVGNGEVALAARLIVVTYVSKTLLLEGERREIVELLARMVRMLAALYFPLYACLLVVGREFVTVLFTESYRGSWPIFAVNLTLIPLGILTSACDPVLRAYPAYTS